MSLPLDTGTMKRNVLIPTIAAIAFSGALVVSGALVFSSALVLAQGGGHSGHVMPTPTPTPNPTPSPTQGRVQASASTIAYQSANSRMHKGMDITYSGDADVDFASGMVPHHQGAVDMAKIVLQFGKDPELRKLAESVVATQEKEIGFMAAWLKKNGK